MNAQAALDLVEELEDNLDDLEEHLQPILTSSLATTSRKLPLLDRAKLNVLLVYSLESLVFSYLKIHGVQVKEHPVFKELLRVKQYFEKINAAGGASENAQPAATLNKEAAARVIKHGLAGNEKYDLQRAEREAREKFLANRKLRSLESSMKEKAVQNPIHDEDITMSDALTRAAELAAVPQDEPSKDGFESDSSTNNTSDAENGEVAESSAQSPVEQDPKQKKTRPNTKSRRTKRKRETGFHDLKTPEQMDVALERQSKRQVLNAAGGRTKAQRKKDRKQERQKQAAQTAEVAGPASA